MLLEVLKNKINPTPKELDTIDWIDKLEYQHKASLPKFDLRWQLETFPEAKSLIKANLEKEITKCEADIAEADRLQPIFDDIIYRRSSQKDESFWHALVEILYLNPLRIEQRKLLKRDLMYLSMLKGKSKTDNPIGVTPQEISRAKEYPLTDLIEFNKHNTAICPFHTEKTPSLHYYRKSNTCHCFGACQKSFDSIEVYRRLNNCSFVEAVRKLQ